MHALITRAALGMAAALTLWSAAPAAAQEPSDFVERCRRWERNEGREVHCEVRETRLGARETVRVDGRANGGATVKTWDGSGILVRAQIQATARTDAAARDLARRIEVSTGSTIQAEGPETRRGSHWSVSYEIFVPRRTNLQIETNNGPISVAGVTGEMELRAVNGPLALRNVAGDVRGRTTNGPITVTLDGRRWNGQGLDVETTNGPVTLSIPNGYAASLETGTVHGPVNFDFPMTVQGRLTSRIRTELGGGGPPIRVVTTNGPVTVRKQ